MRPGRSNEPRRGTDRRPPRRGRAPRAWLRAAACCGILGAVICPWESRAHPYHVTFAEAELDASRWSLKIAIRTKPEDLEEALRRTSGRKDPLESLPDRERWAYEYVRDKLRFSRANAPDLPLRWVGMEISLQDAWIYLEVLLPSRVRDLTVTDHIFFDLEANQANTLEVRLRDQQTTLTFRRDAPLQLLTIPSPY